MWLALHHEQFVYYFWIDQIFRSHETNTVMYSKAELVSLISLE